MSRGRVLAGGAVPPTPEEAAANPRARSAKLRVFVDWVVDVVGEKAPVGRRRSA